MRNHAIGFIRRRLFSEYTVAFAMIPGVMIGGIHEDYQDDVRRNLRKNIFIDFHLIPNLQFEFWRRFETGERKVVDTLAMVHGYMICKNALIRQTRQFFPNKQTSILRSACIRSVMRAKSYYFKIFTNDVACQYFVYAKRMLLFSKKGCG